MYKISLVYQQVSSLFQNGEAPATNAVAEYISADWQSDLSLGDYWQSDLAQPALLPEPPPVSSSGVISGATGAITNVNPGVSDSGDVAVNGPAARGTFDIDGTGVRIGIISDSFNHLGGAAAEEADGDLPASVTVLSDGVTGTDEGRAMAELVHKVAPGAQIYFASMGSGESATAQAVASLQAAGCTVIVDDISWLTEPFFQDGAPLQAAAEAATSAGVSYFTAAGNDANHYYQGTVGTFPTIEITSTAGGAIFIDLQWTQPLASAGGSAYSLGWQLYDRTTHLPIIGLSSLSDEDGRSPVQDAQVSIGAQSYDLVITNDGTGSLVPTDTYKVIVLSSNPLSISLTGAGVGVGSGTVFGHEMPSSVNVVGAVNANAPTQVEPYSAYGPGEFYFGANGSALATPQNLGKPNFLAPDDIQTSVGGNFSPFAGTSAAAPNAAAVGALLQQINPNLTPAQITNALELTANSVGLNGNTAQMGAGLINAEAAAALLYDGSTVVGGTTVYNGTSLSFDRVIAWDNASGNWGTGADWSLAGTPGTTSYVTLGDDLGALTADYIVTLSADGGTVATLTVGNAGTLTTALSVAAGGSLIVAGGAAIAHDGQVTIAATGSLQVDGLLQLDDTLGATASFMLLANAEATAGSFNIIGGVASVAEGASLAVSGNGAIGEGDAGTLSINGNAVVGGNLTIEPTGVLEIGSSGSLSVGGTLTLQPGSTAEIGAGRTLSVGSLNGGAIFAARGHLTIDDGGVLAVSNSTSAYLTGVIGGLPGTVIEHVANTHAHILFSGVAYAGATLNFLSMASLGILEIDKGGGSIVAYLGFDKAQSLTQPMFSTTEVGGHLEVNIACYLRGTRIATRAGEVPVEALRIGDEVLTASGVARPIRWIGRRSYSATEAAARHSLRPIRIVAGALGPLRPRRDLLVSPQHALLLRDPGDGRAVLVPAVQLVNGVTITHEAAGAALTYFHIELAGHDVVLAEGQPAETFVDRDSRAAFDNADEFFRIYPAARAMVPFCATRVDGGAVLARVRAAIADWNGLLPGRLIGSVDRVAVDWVEGWAHDLDNPAGPVLLEIVVDDAVVGVLLADQFRTDLAAMNDGRCAFFFAMPKGQAIGRASRLSVRRVPDGREVPRTAASLASDGIALDGHRAAIPA